MPRHGPAHRMGAISMECYFCLLGQSLGCMMLTVYFLCRISWIPDDDSAALSLAKSGKDASLDAPAWRVWPPGAHIGTEAAAHVQDKDELLLESGGTLTLISADIAPRDGFAHRTILLLKK